MGGEGKGVGWEVGEEQVRGNTSGMRQNTQLRSRREMGSFYMKRRKDNEQPRAESPATPVSSQSAPSVQVGTASGPAPDRLRRGQSFAKNMGAHNAGVNPSSLLDRFATLTPTEQAHLVEQLERKARDRNVQNTAGGAASAPRRGPQATAMSMDDDVGEQIENPVPVSSKSNLSDLSAEEVESEELEGEAKEVGVEVERWLHEGFDAFAAEEGVAPSGASQNAGDADDYTDRMRMAAMENAMRKMQTEIAELRVKLRKAEKKSKGWKIKFSSTSNKKDSDLRHSDSKDASLDSKRIETELRETVSKLEIKLEDVAMERDQYMEQAKMLLEQTIQQQDGPN